MSREDTFVRAITSEFLKFLDKCGASASTFRMDTLILRDVGNRYFKDVDRLHKFHGITRINAHKIAGYITYWLTKLKPISVADQEIYKFQPDFCMYINELFALYFAAGRINSIERKNIRLNDELFESFLYLLKYRITTGDNLSMHYSLFEQKSTPELTPTTEDK